MKASSWLPRLLKAILRLRLLVLILTVTKLNTAAESPPQSKYEGVVGGNVTFYCPVDDPQKLQFLYFQKGDTFVNGYYHSRNVTTMWPNTRIDLSQTAIHMYELNISHAGEYRCCFMYIDRTFKNPTLVPIQLLITAPFSKPLLTKTCGDINDGCNVTCASHSGYPRQQITWQMEPVGSQMWKELKSEVLTNQTTQMFNVSSTGYINCSSGEVKVSCSVGNIVSDMISVCAPPPSSKENLLLIIAVVISSVVVIAVILLLIKMRRSAARSVTTNVPLENVALAGVEEAP